MPPFRLTALPVAYRLQIATLVAFLTLVGLSAAIYGAGSRRIEESRVATLRAIVQSAASIAAKYEADEKAGRLSGPDARAAVLNALRALRYEGAEYVWVNDMTPVVLMHPTNPKLEGKDASGITDPDGKHMFVAFVDTVKTAGSGMVSYMWPKPGHDTPVPKLSYVQGFAPWGWVIGTGVYADDLAVARRHLAWTLTGVTLAAGSSWCLASACPGRSGRWTRSPNAWPMARWMRTCPA